MRRREFLAAALAAAAGPERFAGITVMPEYLQSEGIERVLGNLKRARANAVATSPYLMAPSDAPDAQREPPIDAGAGSVRLLDRSLFGKRELRVTTAPSFEPDLALYRGLRFQPPPPRDLTLAQGPIVGDFLRAAKKAGLKTYLQIQAAIPPGYRVQFGGADQSLRPRLPDGRTPRLAVSNNLSLASEDVRLYGEALIRDLIQQYPEIDGIRVDWPEYPPYSLDDVFLDFSDPAKAAAARLGFDFERMRNDAGAAYRYLHGSLTARDLEAKPHVPEALAELFRFKAALVDEMLAGYRKACGTRELMPNAFPPPFNTASGMDYARAAKHSSAISVKLYTMHWPMMVRFYGDPLAKANPKLDERKLVRAIVRWMDIADDAAFPHLTDYVYPDPDTPHPVGIEAQKRKLRAAQQAAGATPVIGLAHGYGPPEDFRRRLQAAWQGANRRVWINRYGYLSDTKIAIAGEVLQ